MKDLLTNHKESTGFSQPLRLAYYALLVSLLTASGYSADRFAILEPSCNGMEMETECRKAKIVKFYIDALNAKVDLDTFYDVNTCGLAAVEAVNITGYQKVEGTITAAGTNGAQTINKMAGSVNIAAGQSSVVVTNSLVVAADTLVFPVLMTADASANYVDSCVVANGSFTVTLNANATGAVKIGFHLIKVM
jgi:hypothetical protein